MESEEAEGTEFQGEEIRNEKQERIESLTWPQYI